MSQLTLPYAGTRTSSTRTITSYCELLCDTSNFVAIQLMLAARSSSRSASSVGLRHHTRAPMCTPMSSPQTSHSSVCSLGAHLDAERLHCVADGHRAADRALRAVEHREEPVSGDVRLAARKRVSRARTRRVSSSSACQSQVTDVSGPAGTACTPSGIPVGMPVRYT